MSATDEVRNWVTSEPHHIPGYAGFLPKLSQALGKTYGSSTHELLVDRQDATVGGGTSNGKGGLGVEEPKQPTQSAKDKWLLKRDRKYSLSLIPGYAGFVPKERENVGLGYTESCALANSHFEGDYIRLCKARAEVSVKQTDNWPKRQHSGYLPEISATWSKLRESNINNRKSTDLFTGSSDDKLAPLNVGYSGFVPNLRNQFGQSFKEALGSALQEFNEVRSSTKESLSLPVIVNRTAPPPRPRLRVYPTDSGAIPHYQGHIPGNKYNFGKTFERATFESLNTAVVLSGKALM